MKKKSQHRTRAAFLLATISALGTLETSSGFAGGARGCAFVFMYALPIFLRCTTSTVGSSRGSTFSSLNPVFSLRFAFCTFMYFRPSSLRFCSDSSACNAAATSASVGPASGFGFCSARRRGGGGGRALLAFFSASNACRAAPAPAPTVGAPFSEEGGGAGDGSRTWCLTAGLLLLLRPTVPARVPVCTCAPPPPPALDFGTDAPPLASRSVAGPAEPALTPPAERRLDGAS